MNSGILVKIQIWSRLPHISANEIARFWNRDISWTVGPIFLIFFSELVFRDL